ncbi:hypothetical protein JYU34_006941 [Plutella xylostella]|uniref:ferroxidase n=1 Tax=Plutella xylostella TaxID=51655 RepID=A0ABQ7QT86_PLUXY|nr:hypothetical protein JYU34_006941 [Plutella xylostella]
MLRHMLRTSQRLARPKFNNCATVLGIKATYITKPVLNCEIVPVCRNYSVNKNDNPETQATEVDHVVFEQICNETLESLCDYFEELVESAPHLKGADITFSDGVLTVDLGPSYGTYVINRQTPNKQVWLSSPTSGPKRYDLVLKNGGYWLYKHDGITLHQLLQTEISEIVKGNVEFSKCSHSLV